MNMTSLELKVSITSMALIYPVQYLAYDRQKYGRN